MLDQQQRHQQDATHSPHGDDDIDYYTANGWVQDATHSPHGDDDFECLLTP